MHRMSKWLEIVIFWNVSWFRWFNILITCTFMKSAKRVHDPRSAWSQRDIPCSRNTPPTCIARVLLSFCLSKLYYIFELRMRWSAGKVVCSSRGICSLKLLHFQGPISIPVCPLLNLTNITSQLNPTQSLLPPLCVWPLAFLMKATELEVVGYGERMEA